MQNWEFNIYMLTEVNIHTYMYIYMYMLYIYIYILHGLLQFTFYLDVYKYAYEVPSNNSFSNSCGTILCIVF